MNKKRHEAILNEITSSLSPKCTGVDCPVKIKCHRYSKEISNYNVGEWINPPFKIKKKKNKKVFDCLMFWGENQQYLMDMLKQIVK